MSKIERISIRATTETREAIQALGRLWGPIQPLSTGEVIEEAIRRAMAVEEGAKKNRKSRQTHLDSV